MEAEESFPGRQFCCLLTGADSSVFAHSDGLLDDAAFLQFAASSQHLLISAFDHYAKLLWTRQQDRAWIPQPNQTSEITRSAIGNSLVVELQPGATLDYLRQRFCHTLWGHWLGSAIPPTSREVKLFCPDSSKPIQVKFVATSFDDFAEEVIDTVRADARKHAYDFLKSQLVNGPESSILIVGKTSNHAMVRDQRQDFILHTSSRLTDDRVIELQTLLHCVQLSEFGWERFEKIFPPGVPPVRSCCVLLQETESVSLLRSKAEINWKDIDEILVPASSYLCTGVFNSEFLLFVLMPKAA